LISWDAVIIRQQDQIDRLVRELQQLRQSSVADSGPTERQLRDELPPHY
jgi:SlyX protein